MKFNRNYFAAALASLALIVFISGIMISPQLPDLQHIQEQTVKDKIYALQNSPKSYHANSMIPQDLPEVTTKYTDSVLFFNKYFFVAQLENMNVKNNIFNNVFFIGRHIAELRQWGNEVPVKFSAQNTKDLLAWWSENEPSWWEFTKSDVYNSWEAAVARYINLVDKEITDIPHFKEKNPIDNYASLQKRLFLHQRLLTLQVLTSPRPVKEKQYLLSLINDSFQYLNNQIYKKVPKFDPVSLSYPLKDIMQDKEYGLYSVKMDTDSQPDYFRSNASVIVGDSVFKQNNNENRTTLFKNVVIDGKNDTLKLKLADIYIPVKNLQWENRVSDNIYQYRAPLPTIKDPMVYMLHIKYKAHKRLIFEMDNFPTDPNQTGQVLFREELIPNNQENAYQLPIFMGPIPNYVQYFVLNTLEPLTNEDIAGIQFEFQPIFEPKIVLQKTASLPNSQLQIATHKLNTNTYEIDVASSTSAQDSLIRKALHNWSLKILDTTDTNRYSMRAQYLPKKISDMLTVTLLVISSILFLLPSMKVLVHLTASLIYKYQYLLNKTRPVFMVLVLLFFWAEFASLRQSADWYMILFLLSVIGLVLSYGLSSQSGFIISGFFFIFGTLMYTLGFELTSEKIISWTVLFLIASMILVAKEIIMKQEPEDWKINLMKHVPFRGEHNRGQQKKYHKHTK